MTKFERDKVYKTRDGQLAVRVLCTDAPGEHAIIGIYVSGPISLGGCAPRHLDGRYGNADSHIDLMLPKPEPIVEWGAANCSGNGFYYQTEKAARARISVGEPPGLRLAKRVTTFED